MSDRSQWKMLHLLYTLPPSKEEGLTGQELADAGIDCEPDTFRPLTQTELIRKINDRYVLTEAAIGIRRIIPVAGGRTGVDIIAVPRAAPHYSIYFSKFAGCRITTRISIIPIVHPFPHIASHIERAIHARAIWVTSNRRDIGKPIIG